MVITTKDVEYVLGLSRLELATEEKEKFTSQLDSILKYMEQLERISTEEVNPTSHVMPMKNVYREDEVKQFEGLDKIMANAPKSEEGFYSVPRILE